MSKYVKEIIEEVEIYKKNGHKKIALTELLDYLQEIARKVENDAKCEGGLSEISRLRYQRRLAMYTAKLASRQESFRAIISFATNSSRSLFLLNGGAAIAVLAFLGNVWSNPTRLSPPDLLNSLISFSSGLIFSVLCVALSYFAQFYYAESHKIRIGHIWRRGAMILGFLGLVAFCVGTFFAYHAFTMKFRQLNESYENRSVYSKPMVY